SGVAVLCLRLWDCHYAAPFTPDEAAWGTSAQLSAKPPYGSPETQHPKQPQKAPRKYFDPLAIGAPRPLLELPSRLERMIHFIPPHNEKVRAKAPELVGQVDVILGNLEAAIPIDAKEADREGLIAMAKAIDFGSTGLWARVNALNSPWFIGDMTRLVG